jgi:hypothetical protein
MGARARIPAARVTAKRFTIRRRPLGRRPCFLRKRARSHLSRRGSRSPRRCRRSLSYAGIDLGSRDSDSSAAGLRLTVSPAEISVDLDPANANLDTPVHRQKLPRSRRAFALLGQSRSRGVRGAGSRRRHGRVQCRGRIDRSPGSDRGGHAPAPGRDLWAEPALPKPSLRGFFPARWRVLLAAASLQKTPALGSSTAVPAPRRMRVAGFTRPDSAHGRSPIAGDGPRDPR